MSRLLTGARWGLYLYLATQVIPGVAVGVYLGVTRTEDAMALINQFGLL